MGRALPPQLQKRGQRSKKGILGELANQVTEESRKKGGGRKKRGAQEVLAERKMGERKTRWRRTPEEKCANRGKGGKPRKEIPHIRSADIVSTRGGGNMGGALRRIGKGGCRSFETFL